ncbi:hypothetical protein ACIGXA_34725 [Streptomyces fildesensis]|uniref:LytR/CpsA/Psr regulator C-terminal domain-containing protein n=1 Tax=Streptomyces fildesensis TaxID=375757 RepID=A0ABW8CIP9_9ACTN
MTSPVHFQQQLAEELTARAAALPPAAAVPARPRHTRRIAVTALGLAAAATAVVLIPHSAGTTAPEAGAGPSSTHAQGGSAPVLSNASYTVAPRKDGTVSLQVSGAEVSGLQTALRSLGVPAVVLRASDSCPDKVRTNPNLESVESQDPKNGRVMVIRPSAIPHGDFLVLVQSNLKGSLHPDKMGSMEVMLTTGEPACYPASQSGLGEG